MLIHEDPFINRTGDLKLQVGDVVTVEPGVYREGFGGIRVEDLVVVTDNGCRVLDCIAEGFTVPAITTNDLKNGITLELDNGLFQVVEFQHVKPGKGGAFVRTKLRNVKTGNVFDRTFNAGVRVEQALLEKKDMQFLYRDGNDYVFMDTENYDQLHVAPVALGDAANYMVEQSIAIIAFYQGEIVSRRDPGVRRAGDHRHRAGHAGRPRVGCPQAGDTRDRSRAAGSAVHQPRRPSQGRHAQRRLHHPSLRWLDAGLAPPTTSAPIRESGR